MIYLHFPTSSIADSQFTKNLSVHTSGDNAVIDGWPYYIDFSESLRAFPSISADTLIYITPLHTDTNRTKLLLSRHHEEKRILDRPLRNARGSRGHDTRRRAVLDGSECPRLLPHVPWSCLCLELMTIDASCQRLQSWWHSNSVKDRLVHCLATATTFEDWEEAAFELDELQSTDLWWAHIYLSREIEKHT